jgi:integrase
MVKSKLKNVTRIAIQKNGRTTWVLVDHIGEISAFTYFCEKNGHYAFATQKRYAEVVSLFIDYLIETKALSQPVTKQHLNAVLDAYPILLRDGSDALIRRLTGERYGSSQDTWLLEAAAALHRLPTSPKSFDNLLAPINRFLALSESLAVEAFEIAEMHGLAHENSYKSLFTALDNTTVMSSREKHSLKQNSVLGSVIRFRSSGVSRPGRMKSGVMYKNQKDRIKLDFPFEKVMDLVRAATSWRDRCLWLLLAGCGLRVSEALNLRWGDIDIPNQKIYINDPHGRHFGGDLPPQEKLRFKGRNVSMTYMIQEFRVAFFQSLQQYLKDEYITVKDKNAASYVFQYVDVNRKGQPYVNVSSSALCGAMEDACRRAQIDPPSDNKSWTPHSLRHLYGVYMLNDYPVDVEKGIYGLDLTEVQMLMGHGNIDSTRHYAKKKSRALVLKLEVADRTLMDMPSAELPLTLNASFKRLKKQND